MMFFINNMSVCFIFSDGIDPRTSAWESIENLIDRFIKNQDHIYLFNRNPLDSLAQYYLKKVKYKLVSIMKLVIDWKKPISMDDWNVETHKTNRPALFEQVVDICDNKVLVYGGKHNHFPDLDGNKVYRIYDSVNIANGSNGIGHELSINSDFPVYYCGREYYSVYSLFKNKAKRSEYFSTSRCKDLDCWLEHLMHLKFKQYPNLVDKVTSMGGAEWLSRCSHFSAASTRWSGVGANSKYIECLVMAYSSAYFEMIKNKNTPKQTA